MLVSVIIPTYNGLELLKECLPSVRAAIEHAQLAGQVEIVVADDASQDGTADWLAQRWPEVVVARSASNRGFAVTANAGIAAAKGAWLALLNNDTVVEAAWLSAVQPHFNNPRVGAIASRIVYYDRPDILESNGDDYTVVGVAVKHGNRRPAAQALQPRACFSPCGASAFYRGEAIRAVGGYWERLGAYYEDVELGFRLHLQGWDTLYEPQSVCRHKVSASYGRESYRMKFNAARNIELVWFACMPAGLLLRYLPAHATACLLHLIYRVTTRRGLSFVHGKLAFWTHLPYVLRRRKRVQSLRKISNRELCRRLEKHWFKSLIGARMKS